jgi:probable rRNA maturation factor
VLEIDVNLQHTPFAIDAEAIRATAQAVLRGEAVDAGEISIAVVDDPTIHDLNRRYLDHDYPTDVLSFSLGDNASIEGEVIVSADTAAQKAVEFEIPAIDELLLYVVHGVLHLVGYDDRTDEDCLEMRARERQYLRQCGIALCESTGETSR